MDTLNNEPRVSEFETNVLPKMLSEAGLKIEDLNSLDQNVRMAFVSGAGKLHKIDEDGTRIKPVKMGWLSGATRTLFETASGSDAELRKNKANETYLRGEDYIRGVKSGFTTDPTNELTLTLNKFSREELPFLVTRK